MKKIMPTCPVFNLLFLLFQPEVAGLQWRSIVMKWTSWYTDIFKSQVSAESDDILLSLVRLMCQTCQLLHISWNSFTSFLSWSGIYNGLGNFDWWKSTRQVRGWRPLPVYSSYCLWIYILRVYDITGNRLTAGYLHAGQLDWSALMFLWCDKCCHQLSAWSISYLTV